MKLTYGALDLTASPYLIEFGLDSGAPQNVSEALAFLLQDGEVELSSRASNRTLAFNVLIEGANLLALATAEQNLVAETEKPLNLLTLDPEDSGPPTVYEVFRAQVSLVRDDDWERSRIRRYAVEVRAYPFVRSTQTFTSTGAAPGGTTTTTLDACGSATGWTGTVNGASATVSAVTGPPTTIGVSGTFPLDQKYILTLQKTFAATTTSTNLLVVDWLGTGSILTATGDGVELERFAEGASPTSGYTRTWFRVAAASLAVTRFTLVSAGVPAVRSLQIDNVAVTNASPIVGGNRQQLRSLSVPGSARTQGSLAVQSETSALGDTIVYVYPSDDSTSGYTPSLRQFRGSGNTVTPDTTKVSGSTEPLTGLGVTFNIPIGLFPYGLYLLMGRLATSGGGTPLITYSGKTNIGGLGLTQVGGSTTITTTTAYQNFALGRLILPASDLDPAAASVALMSLTVQASSTCTYDELWLFNTSIGRLIQVNCGTGTAVLGGPARRLFIEPATTRTPRPTVRVGHAADRSDSHYPTGAFPSWQIPEFSPPLVNALVVTSNATDAVITLSGYARWHTHAAS